MNDSYNTKRISRDPEINAYTRLGEEVALKLMVESPQAKAIQEYRNKNSRAEIWPTGYQSDAEIMRYIENPDSAGSIGNRLRRGS